LEAQEVRFLQLAKVISKARDFTILDYGCGYGAYADYLDKLGFEFTKFYGFDILESAVTKASTLHHQPDKYFFTTNIKKIPMVDFAIASGVFNIRLNATHQQWTDYVLQCLQQINKLSQFGFASNFLTKYSDPEKMSARLYYADPCLIFDYCKTHFSRNVALLHDYQLYDFTIIVKK
jgi:SAM-dependent methyltransferase